MFESMLCYAPNTARIWATSYDIAELQPIGPYSGFEGGF